MLRINKLVNSIKSKTDKIRKKYYTESTKDKIAIYFVNNIMPWAYF